MSSPCGLEFAVGFAWICLFLLRRRTMKAVGPEALGLSRSPPGARARAVVSGRWAKYAPRIRSSDKHSGQGQRKAGSDHIRGRRKRIRADQTLVAP